MTEKDEHIVFSVDVGEPVEYQLSGVEYCLPCLRLVQREAAAGNAVLDAFEDGSLLKNVNEMGAYLKEKLREMQSRHSCISDVRGLGLMVAIEFSHEDGSPAPDLWTAVKAGCLKRHMLTLNCGVYGNGMRFATPLNVKKEEIDEGLQILEKAICEVEAG